MITIAASITGANKNRKTWYGTWLKHIFADSFLAEVRKYEGFLRLRRLLQEIQKRTADTAVVEMCCLDCVRWIFHATNLQIWHLFSYKAGEIAWHDNPMITIKVGFIFGLPQEYLVFDQMVEKSRGHTSVV